MMISAQQAFEVRSVHASDAAIRFIQLLLVAVLAGVGVLSRTFWIEPESVIDAQCWALLAMFVWSVWSWARLTQRLFDWYLVFLTAAYAFNAGQAFLQCFRWNEFGLLDAEFSATTLMQTLYMVQLALAALHAGALYSASHQGTTADFLERKVPLTEETASSLRLVGLALLLVAFPFALYMTQQAISVVLAGGYFALYQQKAATGLGAGPKVLATFLVPGILFFLAGARQSYILRWAAVGMVCGYALLNFFLGSRHEAALLLVAFAWMWDRQIHRLNVLGLGLAGVLAITVVFPLVAATRNAGGSERASVGYLLEQYGTLKNPAVAAVHEMGGSMNTVAHTLQLVPSSHDFERGAGYAYGVFILFPNFFWDLHPTIARQIPGNWLTWQIDPITAEEGGGMGYSFIAEEYLNFGWSGMIPVMLLLGYLLGRTVRWADVAARPERAAWMASAMYFFVFYARAELAVVIRGIVWYACLPYLAVLVLIVVQRALSRNAVLRESVQGTTWVHSEVTSLRRAMHP